MIGVVGGGIAGLSAAYRLQQRGHEVRVFEASDDLGGLAAVYETAGDPIEKFYHHLSKSEETIVELAEELGLGEDVEWRIGKNAYYVDGVVHPMDKPWEILSFPHWSLYDKFRLGMLTLDIDVRGGVPSFDTYERLEDFEDVPVEQFAREHTTQNVYETFFEPLLDAKFGDRKDDVSAAWLLGRIKFRGERDILKGEVLGYLDGGFGRLLDALVEAVGRENIETGTRVTDIDTADGAVTGLTAERDGETTTHDVDSVVVATMPNVLEDLTGYPCDIDFQGTVCSVVSMDESLMDTYWLNIADEAPFGALIEHTNFVPAERYGGEHLLYVARYIQSPEEDVWQQDDDEVRETWLSGIENLFPEFDRESVNWVRTARNPRTAPIYERGYVDMVVPYDLGDAVAEGVYYAGMASKAQYPERSLNGGVVAGYECADRIDGRADAATDRATPTTD
ncbi:NAD(P)/FAD-dependent oxidoreductase [Haloarcula pellucida]|uniref:Protoporphyrinogen oxidase n=1 Tax=Haloarcula pellucida TaxID=1427151 RepID=A0A830GME3_9EURY|nr:NAD(P)/FAD-dependent oxidoreductase [Halomicroarcula pellucida]MBX0348415.1 NAD(P)/FAD-dependent oxidoreductase [Halomicroarcula pellucida]GGN93462.1 protoporphyrinogen oxidase [Halomicroarcula pellucida]